MTAAMMMMLGMAEILALLGLLIFLVCMFRTNLGTDSGLTWAPIPI